MSVRAKFVCTDVEVTTQANGEKLSTVKLEPVRDPDPASENGRFFRYTPWGRIEMGTINEVAAAQFQAGKDYFVDFTPAS